jgi:LysR family cys regulon transcriptional activator
MYEFIEKFAPHLTREVVNQAYSCSTKVELDELFDSLTIPEVKPVSIPEVENDTLVVS